jgi:hypothetical protein
MISRRQRTPWLTVGKVARLCDLRKSEDSWGVYLQGVVYSFNSRTNEDLGSNLVEAKHFKDDHSALD